MSWTDWILGQFRDPTYLDDEFCLEIAKLEQMKRTADAMEKQVKLMAGIEAHLAHVPYQIVDAMEKQVEIAQKTLDRINEIK